jgi:hypothetical protein
MAIKLNGSTSGSVALDAPADTSPSGTDVTLTLPTSAGSSGQYLQTNGSGTLSWQTVTIPAATTVIEASGFNTANGGSATSDTIIRSFSSLDFSNYEGNLLQIFARTSINESTNYSDAAVLYVEITNGTDTTVIAGSRNGNPNGSSWNGDSQQEICTGGLYTIPATYATTGITLRLRAAINGTGTFYYGDQPTYSFYDNIGDGIEGGITFHYIVFG